MALEIDHRIRNLSSFQSQLDLKMAPSAQAHQRSHSMLLLQKLLNLRDSASPLTLIIDSLEQTARPVLDEFITRAKVISSWDSSAVPSLEGKSCHLSHPTPPSTLN